MTFKEIEAMANGTEKNKFEEEIVKMDKEKNRVITKVLEIRNNDILDYYKTANPQDREWIKQRIAQLIVEVGESKYFMKFRMEFAKKFMPHIVATKAKVNKTSLLDKLVKLDNVA